MSGDPPAPGTLVLVVQQPENPFWLLGTVVESYPDGTALVDIGRQQPEHFAHIALVSSQPTAKGA